jgi:hypothetical protein
MSLTRLVSAAALVLALAPAAASAQTPTETQSTYDQRLANQQNRIGEGVQNGGLTPYETTRLERGQQHIQNMDNRFMSDGSLSPAEQQRLQRAQNIESQRIYTDRHNASRANFNGPRFANQQQRIGAGIQNGSLSPREAARLSHQEGRIRTYQRNARADGNVTPAEHRHINQAYATESRRIYRTRHDGPQQ